MTQEQFNALEANLKTAKTAGDQRLIDEATQEFVRQTAHCQMKMSGRTKEILENTRETKSDVKALTERFVSGADAMRQRHDADVKALRDEATHREGIRTAKISGAKSMMEILKMLAAAGSGAAILKLAGT